MIVLLVAHGGELHAYGPYPVRTAAERLLELTARGYAVRAESLSAYVGGVRARG